jgi:hypothetical protein
VSTFGNSDSITSILPDTLAPPMIAERPLRVVDGLAEEIQLLLHQVPGRPLRQVHTGDRAVGAVRRAEGIVDV